MAISKRIVPYATVPDTTTWYICVRMRTHLQHCAPAGFRWQRCFTCTHRPQSINMPLLASARSFGVVDVFVHVTMTSLRSSIDKRYGNNTRRDDTKNSVVDIFCCCESELNRVKCMTTASHVHDAFSPRTWCYRHFAFNIQCVLSPPGGAVIRLKCSY